MEAKIYRVTVHLDLHKVSCPGVWLCPKGRVYTMLTLFKKTETTRQLLPCFPLNFKQRFIYEKLLEKMMTYVDLVTYLSQKELRMELVQVFKSKMKMVSLAVFQAPLTLIADPGTLKTCDLDLLFETCPVFPGIIAPKAEVTVRLEVEPTCTKPSVKPAVSSTVNMRDCSMKRIRQMRVCHTTISTSACKEPAKKSRSKAVQDSPPAFSRITLLDSCDSVNPPLPRVDSIPDKQSICEESKTSTPIKGHVSPEFPGIDCPSLSPEECSEAQEKEETISCSEQPSRKNSKNVDFNVSDKDLSKEENDACYKIFKTEFESSTDDDRLKCSADASSRNRHSRPVSNRPSRPMYVAIEDDRRSTATAPRTERYSAANASRTERRSTTNTPLTERRSAPTSPRTDRSVRDESYNFRDWEDDELASCDETDAIKSPRERSPISKREVVPRSEDRRNSRPEEEESCANHRCNNDSSRQSLLSRNHKEQKKDWSANSVD